MDCIVRPFVKETRTEWESSVEERLLCKGKTLSLIPSTENKVEQSKNSISQKCIS